jgi:nicotinate-nucleotide adenylyltransferase
MRVGVFGGTFDPVHLAHLIIAEQCREQGHLDQVWFVPAARPPHKDEHSLTPFHHRVEMLALALAGHPAFRVEDLEKERPGLSYTVDTLQEFHRLRPETDLHLIIGADCLPDLPHWREPARIVELASLLIVARPGWIVWPAEQTRAALGVSGASSLRQQSVSVPLLDISSSDLRRRAAEGRSLRYLLPRAVDCYIAAHRLYRLDSFAR